ncbi:MAG: hypothetical protein Q8N88_06965, partial [Nanoarchaeota archaeon]|nr:hypothetical protein [Nanoarchaeota archaeon]
MNYKKPQLRIWAESEDLDKRQIRYRYYVWKEWLNEGCEKHLIGEESKIVNSEEVLSILKRAVDENAEVYINSEREDGPNKPIDIVSEAELREFFSKHRRCPADWIGIINPSLSFDDRFISDYSSAKNRFNAFKTRVFSSHINSIFYCGKLFLGGGTYGALSYLGDCMRANENPIATLEDLTYWTIVNTAYLSL